MTPDEQQQVQAQLDAGMAHMERQCGDLARAGAQQAMIVAVLQAQLKAANARIAELTPKKEPKLEVVE